MDAIMAEHQIIVDSLLRIPFFRDVSRETLKAIAAKLKFVEFEQGHVVFSEDSLGDSMYLIESGQVKVSVMPPDSLQEKVINYLGPGNFFGEMALLLNQRRSATVTVTIDAELWMLRKADMDDLLAEHPEVALQLTRELSRRLSDVVGETKNRPGYALTAVFGPGVWRLAEQIHRLTGQRVALFDVTGRDLSAQAGPDFQHDKLVILEAAPNLTSDDMVETLGILVDGYDWVLVALPAGYSEISAKAIRLARAVALIDADPETWIDEAAGGPLFYCKGSAAEIARTARKITHRVVGLALSSGGARGIAHIGVLQLLQENNIPLDMVAGTSAGSLFGGLYACGKPLADIAQFARNLIKLIDLKSGLWDPKFKLPWDGLIKGNATVKYLDKHFGNATFAGTTIPFYVVAADVLSGEEVVFSEGPLAEAVRASIGMIGIFSPYRLKGRYLIDGGAVNPVPASVLAENGANIIIASSVIPSIEEERTRGQEASYRYKNPNFFGVLSNMMAIMEREIVKTRMSPVDVLIKPKVEVYSAMDYDKASEFIRLGRAAAEQQLPAIKKLVNYSLPA
jgi:NTE family protein